MAKRRAATIGLILVAGIALAGCTGEPSGAAGGSPSPDATTSAPELTATPDAVAADEALLPMPVDEIRDWAETAVPHTGTAGSIPILSGWLSENTSAHHTTELRSSEAGVHQAQFACRGEGTITLTAGDIGTEPVGEPIVCQNATIAFDITTTTTGMQVVMDLEGAPTIYALSTPRMG